MQITFNLHSHFFKFALKNFMRMISVQTVCKKRFKYRNLIKNNVTYLKYLIFVLILSSIVKLNHGKPIGYSYSKFSGPVSGPEQRVITENEHGEHGYDYIARPDYHFAYGVEDPKSQVLQNREEVRNGDEVKGHYSVMDPDGTHRVVRYKADKVNGFQAEVITNGKPSSIHGVHEYPNQNTHYHQQHHPTEEEYDENDNYNQNYGNYQPPSSSPIQSEPKYHRKKLKKHHKKVPNEEEEENDEDNVSVNDEDNDEDDGY